MPAPLPPEWDSWVEQGAQLAAAPPLRRSEQSSRGASDPKFALGDFLRSIPSQFVDELAATVGRDSGQFRTYREVADKVPPERRVAASWTVHRDLRDKPELLRDGLTVRQAAALSGRKPIDAKPAHRESATVKAQRVREFLADPEVYALIEAEMAQSRHDRKMRKQVRLVHSELAARQRDVEAELRAAREAKSPYEATVQAELDLLKAAQLVHAVGETLVELPQPERLTAAVSELGEEVSNVLNQHADVQDASADADNVIDGEVWQARSARAALAGSNQRDLPAEGRVVIDIVD